MMGGALYGAVFFWDYPSADGFLIRLVWLLVMISCGIFVYAAASLLLRCPEWQWIREALTKKKKKISED